MNLNCDIFVFRTWLFPAVGKKPALPGVHCLSGLMPQLDVSMQPINQFSLLPQTPFLLALLGGLTHSSWVPTRDEKSEVGYGCRKFGLNRFWKVCKLDRVAILLAYSPQMELHN